MHRTTDRPRTPHRTSTRTRHPVLGLLVPLVAATALLAPAAPAGAAPAPAPPAVAAGPPRTSVDRLAVFDRTAGQLPEGIAVLPDGGAYVGWNPLGQIVRVDPDGTHRVVATLPPRPAGAGLGGLGGLSLDRDGSLFAAYSSGDPASHGIWRLDPDGALTRLAALPVDALLNDITDGPFDDLYVTDSRNGAVHRVRRDGSTSLLVRSPLLEPAPGAPFPVGANGITRRGTTLYIANTFTETIHAVRVRPDGTAGPLTTHLDGTGTGLTIDGLTVDGPHLWAATAIGNTVVRIDRRGHVETVADAADGLDFPASLDVRTTRGARQIHVTNFAFGPTSTTPSVDVITVRRR